MRDDVRQAHAELVDLIGPVKAEAFQQLLLGQIPEVAPTVAPVVVPPVQRAIVRPAAPTPTPAPVADVPPAGAELPGLDDLTFVESLGGSTGAQLFEDAGGVRYVVKSGSSNAHIQSEYLADELYRALGANVPRARLVERDGTTYKIAEFVDGKLLSELSGKRLAAAHAELQKHFAADALLGSWDVIGLGADNIIVDKAGKVWRIDNGGSLLFRAQGGTKELGDFLDELWTLRDSNVNRSAAAVFGEMEYGAIANQLSDFDSLRNDIMGRIPDPQLRAIMAKRFDHAADLAQIYRTFSDDKYVDIYIDRFSYHNTWIQSSGVTRTLPRELKGINENDLEFLVDENGVFWDNLRGSNGIYAQFLAELDRRNTSTRGLPSAFIAEWFESQGGDSWNRYPTYVKDLLARYRPSDYWVPTGLNPRLIESVRSTYGDDLATDAVAAMNAFSYETLRRVDMGVRPSPGVLRLLRTEARDVMKTYDLNDIGDVGQIKRGAVESTSLVKPVSVFGGYLTEQDVPLHRVYGMYPFGFDKTVFHDDGENEILALLDGLEVRFKEVIIDR